MVVSTPCIGVCVLDQANRQCLGCGRTLAEIGAWGALSEVERRAIMAVLPQRPGHAAWRDPDQPERAPDADQAP